LNSVTVNLRSDDHTIENGHIMVDPNEFLRTFKLGDDIVAYRDKQTNNTVIDGATRNDPYGEFVTDTIITWGSGTLFKTIGKTMFKGAIRKTTTELGKEAVEKVGKEGAEAVTNKAIEEGAKKVAANLGKSYGKFGTVVKNPSIKIVDFSTHGLNQAITRGVTTKVIKSTIDDPVVVLSQRGGSAFAYVSNDAVVVVDKAGKIITTYAKNYFDVVVKQVLKETM